MRMIDADQAVEEIDDIFSVDDGKGLIPVGITKALVKSMLTLESITPTVAEDTNVLGKWISVKDRLPMLMESVLFTGKNYYGSWFLAQRGYYDGTFWHSDNNGTVYATTPVTHWMPLPEPPEEVSGDD